MLIKSGLFKLLFIASVGLIFLQQVAADSYLQADNEVIIPSGMIPSSSGWQHGSLFSAPDWLLSMYNLDEMSHAVDYGPTPKPTETPMDINALISAGYSSLDGGNFRDAYNYFLKATELYPSSDDAWYGLGRSLEGQKKYISALDAYGKAISYGQSPYIDWKYYEGKGRVEYALNKFGDAVSDLNTAISHYEAAQVSDPEALDEMNRLLEDAKNKSTMQYGGYL